MTITILLHVKAEVVMGVLLAVRNRTVRVVYLSSLIWISISVLDQFGAGVQTYRQTSVFLIAGSIAAVIGSRLLAPGGALAASRHVAAPFLIAPLGRLSGCALVILPIVVIASLSLRVVEVNPLRLLVAAAAFSGAIAAGVMALALAIGRSAAAAVGFFAVWMGIVPLNNLPTVFDQWPSVQNFFSILWQLLPLQWRADRLLNSPGWLDPFVFAGWTLAGVMLAGWYSTPVRLGTQWIRGPACRH